MEVKEHSFASLFKTFRLKSGFATLVEFGTALTKEGLVYEDSLFSHWQKGDRVPKDRNLILFLLRLFMKKGALSTVEEANLFLASANQRDLDAKEIALLPANLFENILFTAPDAIPLFVGREKYLQKICWRILNKQPLLLHGVAGTGKTVLTIKTAHILKDKFSDGVLWYRCDNKQVNDMVNDIARMLGGDVSRITDSLTKKQIITNLFLRKNLFLILDNVESAETIEPFLTISNPSFSLLATSKNSFDSLKMKRIKISGFASKEMHELAKKILGVPFVLMNVKRLQRLAKLVDYSPLALTVLLRRIESSPRSLPLFLSHFKNESSILYQSAYDNKTLYRSLNLSFRRLSSDLKELFISLGIFQGTDFSLEAVAFIQKLAIKETKVKLLTLQKLSLIEQPTIDHYRLHPLISVFNQRKITNTELFNRLAWYYLQLLKKFKRGNSTHYAEIENILENILISFKHCYRLKYYYRVIELWEYLGIFLWDTGRWNDVKKYGFMMCQASKRLHDKQALAKCYIRELCWLYYWQGDIEKAEKYVQDGMKIAQMLNDMSLLALGWIRFGKICESKQRCGKALQFFEQALTYFAKKGDREKQGDIFTYIGETYWLLGQHEKAKYYLHHALRIVNAINDLPQKTTIFSRLGCLALNEKNYHLAMSYFKKSLITEKQSGRRVGDTFWNNLAFGLAYEMLGKHHIAQEKFQLAKKEMMLVGYTKQILSIDVFPMIFQKELAKSGFFTVRPDLS